MKKQLAVIAALLAVGAVHAEEMHWAKTFAKAAALAKSTHRLVMVDFYTDWCGWCKKLDADTYPNPKVVKLSEQFVPVHVNAEKEGVDQAKKYGVTGYPTILFLDGDGNVVSKVVGYLPPAGFADQMTLALQVQHLPDLQAKAKANPSDSATLVSLVMAYGAQDKKEPMLAALAGLRKADPTDAKGNLAKGLNAAGDCFQNGNKLTEAEPYFVEAAKVAHDKSKAAYALISLATCYMQTKELKKMGEAAQKVLDLGPAGAEYADQAKQMVTLSKTQK